MPNEPEAPDQPMTLRFNLGSIPVSVEPFFWLVTLLFGLRTPKYAVAWVAIVFVSVLLHELGHAVAALAFGSPTRIRLYSFGGLTYHKPLSRWRSVVVSLAGPGAGFILGGALHYFYTTHDFTSDGWAWAVYQARWVNVGWGLINLLPVLPLDGGHVMQGILGERRYRATLVISLLTAVAVVAWAVTREDRYMIYLFGYLAIGSLRMFLDAPTPIEPVYRERRAPLKPGEDKALLDRGWSQLFAGADTEAEKAARTVLTEASDPKIRNRALDLLAWVMLARGDDIGAFRQLERVQPPDQVRALTQAMALELAGHLEAAIAPALKANELEPSDATAQLLLRLFTQTQRYEEGIKLAESFAWSRPGTKEAALSTLYSARNDHHRAAHFAQLAFEARRRASDALDAARHLARSGDAAAALTWIERALGAGFTDTAALQTDPDFEAVRGLSDFAPVIARAAGRLAS